MAHLQEDHVKWKEEHTRLQGEMRRWQDEHRTLRDTMTRGPGTNPPAPQPKSPQGSPRVPGDMNMVRLLASSVRSATTVWSWCSPGVGGRSRSISWRIQSTAGVSRTRSICPRWSVVVSSSPSAPPQPPVRRLLPSRTASFSWRRSSRSRRIGSGAA